MQDTSTDLVNDFVRRRLRNIRQQRKLSVRQMALLVGMPESSYSCLEHGHYRITLQNLRRILEVLQIGIGEVWPPEPLPRPRGAPAALRPDTSSLNYFRFQELSTLTTASQAALFLGQEKSSKLIYSARLNSREARQLQACLPTQPAAGWRVFQKRSDGTAIHLCLKDAFMGEHLERLVELYMDLWLATFLA